MESGSRRHHRSRSARGPPPLPPQHHHPRHAPSPHGPNPSLSPAAGVYRQRFPMEDDAISTLMDIDDSPLNGAGFLDEEDGEGEMFFAPQRRGGEVRGPLPFTGFFNSFDGADFDDADLD